MGLDLGGGGVRALLLEPGSGRTWTAAQPWRPRGAPCTSGLGIDIPLDEVWRAFATASRAVLARAAARPEQIAGIATSAMRFGSVVLDSAGAPLYAAPNRDARAAMEGFQLAAEYGPALHEATGIWPLPVALAARLRWLQAQRPDDFPRADCVLALSDWVTWRLCGERLTDPSQAGVSLLLDLNTRRWDDDWIERLSLPRKLFPDVVPSGTHAGPLSAEAAADFGLRAGTPVCVGGGDSQCALVGSRAVAPGMLGAVTGTTAPVLAVVSDPVRDPDGRLWASHHCVEGAWVLESNGGPMGEAFDWLARLLHPDSPRPAERLMAEAEDSEPGAFGLTSTLGVEVMNAREMGLPVGHLSLTHLTQPDDSRPGRHLARAVTEGIAFGVQANLDQVREAIGERIDATQPVAVSGGLARSPFWGSLLANVLGTSVSVVGCTESSALGAALCAGVGSGEFSDLRSAAADVPANATRYEPDPTLAETYASLYEAWTRAREALAPARAAAGGHVMPWMLRAVEATEPAHRGAWPHPRILASADLDSRSQERLGEIGSLEYASFRERMRLLTGPSLIEALQGVEVFVTEVDIVDADALAKLPDLRVVATCRGDAVNIDVDACTAHGIPVLHAPGRNADAVADLTLAFMLMLARRLPEATRFLRAPDVRAGDMGKMGQAFSSLRGRELGGRTVGLVGLGAVGRQVARRLAGFGARILACDPLASAEQAARAGARLTSLEELLDASDIVSLHATVTEESRALIGRPELARMREGAVLVNTARAALVDEAALIDALLSGHLAGAALDTFSVEPPGADHPLMKLEQVIATPHVGGNTLEVSGHQGRIVADALDALIEGRRPACVLNPDTLERLDWSAPRPAADPATLARLRERPRPAVSDLQRDAGAADDSPPAASGPGLSPEQTEKLSRVIDAFLDGLSSDALLAAFARDQDVTLHFVLSDAALHFHFRLFEGAVTGAPAAPTEAAAVQLRMKAAVLDGMLLGTLNAMEAAMQGDIAFTGDAGKAMTLQHIQSDLERIYTAARASVGDLGDLAASKPEARPAANAGDVPGAEVRHQIVAAVNELYSTELITATGGNVSARIPGREEIWITPSQLFKGDLAPEVLVRIDLDGQSLDEGSRSPSSEWSVHCAIYKARPEAAAVVHAHAPHATILANTGLPFLPISTEAAFFGEIPRIDFIMPGTRDLAEAVAEAMANSWATLMVNHGLIVAGRSLRRAADMVEIIDRTAEVILGCYAVGREPPTLPDDIVAKLRAMGDLIA